jgi:hypothetical protein
MCPAIMGWDFSWDMMGRFGGELPLNSRLVRADFLFGLLVDSEHINDMSLRNVGGHVTTQNVVTSRFIKQAFTVSSDNLKATCA